MNVNPVNDHNSEQQTLNLTPDASYDFVLLALCIWREARGELLETKQAVGWSIRNRVYHPKWWGHSWSGVILMPYQYSSFNHNDPNSSKLPVATDPSWEDSLRVASWVYSPESPSSDLSHGADSYFDMSMDTNPPSWASDGSKVHTVDMGRLHFYKTL